MILTYLWVGVGGAIGSVARFWVDGVISTRFPKFPMGILTINVTGSFLIGLLFAVTGSDGRWFVGSTVRAFLMIGICGGYTTFSSFSLNTLRLAQSGQWGSAFANVALSVALCLLAVWLGYALGAALNPKTGG